VPTARSCPDNSLRGKGKPRFARSITGSLGAAASTRYAGEPPRRVNFHGPPLDLLPCMSASA
jgi:hypothetical protein